MKVYRYHRRDPPVLDFAMLQVRPAWLELALQELPLAKQKRPGPVKRTPSVSMCAFNDIWGWKGQGRRRLTGTSAALSAGGAAGAAGCAASAGGGAAPPACWAGAGTKAALPKAIWPTAPPTTVVPSVLCVVAWLTLA